MQDVRNVGLANGKPAVLLIINRQPGANIIETVDRVTALLPELRASIPASDRTSSVMMDRTTTDPRLAARGGARAADRRRRW